MAKKYGTNDYREFIFDFDIEDLDELRNALTGSGREGTHLEGCIATSTIGGRVTIEERGPHQYTLRDCVDNAKPPLHVRTDAQHSAHTSRDVLVEIVTEELERRLKCGEYCSVDQYYSERYGRRD